MSAPQQIRSLQRAVQLRGGHLSTSLPAKLRVGLAYRLTPNAVSTAVRASNFPGPTYYASTVPFEPMMQLQEDCAQSI
ncbi:hypothetical protein [Arenicella chitinivorans]|uniref:hypothetical protein n=1 Tax=Arenicella chitinivorans TaxID=1329800 RepID=UPI001E34F8CC|nr:hypothetical protein [Arenicella chitinivorans]